MKTPPAPGRSSTKWFKAVAAMAENRVIGRGNRLPWHLPGDFKWFRRLTTGHVLIMGRKTLESLPGLLSNRELVVLSRTAAELPGARVVANPDQLGFENDPREVFVCGGAEIYRLLLPRCSDLYLTRVKREVEGDAFFPPFEDAFELAGIIEETPEYRIEHYRRRELAGGGD